MQPSHEKPKRVKPPKLSIIKLKSKEDGGAFGSVGSGCWRRGVSDTLEQRVIRPVERLSTSLVFVYKNCNNNFAYDHSKRPKKFLTQPSEAVSNNGRDNAHNDLILFMGECLCDETTGSTYRIRGLLGRGTFGIVARAINEITAAQVAIKIIKNDAPYYKQSQTEVQLLQKLNKEFQSDKGVQVVQLITKFTYVNHLCIVFELLSINLFELIESNNYRGVSLRESVGPIVKQLLGTLRGCAKLGIVHCDLKPENILISRLKPLQIKLIDFGSACEEHNTIYTYIQSRYYRAPEVLLGVEYTSMIDIWSLV